MSSNSITGALKIEDGWLESTQAELARVWDNFSTFSDVMEHIGSHIREQEFGDVGTELSIYEKKLLMAGMMVSVIRESQKSSEAENKLLMEMIKHVISKKMQEKQNEEEEE